MRIYLMALCIFVSMTVAADSACWPEQKLLNTPTLNLIQSANYFLADQSGPAKTTNAQPHLANHWHNGVCQVQHYTPATKQPLGMFACSELLCVNGECGTNEEYATIAMLQSDGDFAQVLQKSGEAVWIKWQEKTDWGMVPLWDNLEVGVPFAGNDQPVPLYQKLGGKLVEVKSEHVFKVIKSIEYQGFTYLQLQRYLRLSAEDEPEIKLGAEVDVVYLQHRDNAGKLVAVLSSTWCD